MKKKGKAFKKVEPYKFGNPKVEKYRKPSHWFKVIQVAFLILMSVLVALATATQVINFYNTAKNGCK